MNAVERLWRALRAQDWDSVTAQLHPGVVVVWPHDGRRFTSAVAYVQAHRDLSRDGDILTVHRFIAEGRSVAVHAALEARSGAPARRHCAAFYELHDGRIAHGTELWLDAA